jgi:hypothetical protein
MWGAVGGAVVNNNTQYEIAVSVHDSVYNTDFASLVISYNPNSPEKNAKEIEQSVLQVFRKFSIEHLCKFLGVGVTLSLLKEVSDQQDRDQIMYSMNFILVPQYMYPPLARYGYCPLCFQH